jgi:hypothetical protein
MLNPNPWLPLVSASFRSFYPHKAAQLSRMSQTSFHPRGVLLDQLVLFIEPLALPLEYPSPSVAVVTVQLFLLRRSLSVSLLLVLVHLLYLSPHPQL